MDKIFKEVIRDIKEGETWVSGNKVIEMVQGRLQITAVSKNYTMVFLPTVKYNLKDKSINFLLAFEAFEAGKIIKSVVTNYQYQKKGNIESTQLDENDILSVVKDVYFTSEEIRGRWLIMN